MKIGINFDSIKHCCLFRDFLVKYGYKTTFLNRDCQSIRIDTTTRHILGWSSSSYDLVSNYNIEKVINWEDNIGFNFDSYNISRDFIQLLYEMGFAKPDYSDEICCSNIRIQNNQIASSRSDPYSDKYLCTYAIDLNLIKENIMNDVPNVANMPTKEQIISAAQKCPQAESVLKELFPDVFPNDLSVTVTEKYLDYICVRSRGNFKGKGFYLDSKYNWTIENDVGAQVLVPWKKS